MHPSSLCALSNLFEYNFKPGSDGRRLLALKFMETVVLLYTPDPNGSSDPPSDQNSEGSFYEFISVPLCISLFLKLYKLLSNYSF